MSQEVRIQEYGVFYYTEEVKPDLSKSVSKRHTKAFKITWEHFPTQQSGIRYIVTSSFDDAMTLINNWNNRDINWFHKMIGQMK